MNIHKHFEADHARGPGYVWNGPQTNGSNDTIPISHEPSSVYYLNTDTHSNNNPKARQEKETNKSQMASKNAVWIRM